ncbi:MAG: hypothetical protein V2J89_00755 [Halieaceae bacterium]|jgi:hypothetical protein|nr:hypothetical protein [Halieaceae bacterium]
MRLVYTQCNTIKPVIQEASTLGLRFFVPVLLLCGIVGCDSGSGGSTVGVPEPAALPVCGDGSCNGSEWCAACAEDCGNCADGNCEAGQREFVNTEVLVDLNEFAASFDDNLMFPFAELGPWQTRVEEGVLTTFGAAFSFTCLTPRSLFEEPGSALTTANCTLNTAGLMWENPAAQLNDPANPLYNDHWRRNYTGVTSQLLLTVDGQPGLLSFIQIEHTNYINFFSGEFYRDVLNPENPFSGECTDADEDCDPFYKTFVGAVWTPFEPSSATLPDRSASVNLGPVLWPDTGYHDPEDRVISGFGSGTARVEGDYVYLYYTGGSVDDFGVKLARVLIDRATDPGAYEVYDGQGWNPSLPEGFSKEAMADFMDVPGGDSTTLITGVTDGLTTHAMVAETVGGGFVAIEEVLGDGAWTLRLRYAENGLDFGEPFFTVATATSFTEGSLNYPLLTDSQHSTAVIDPASFFVVGSSHEASPFGISRLPVSCR